MDVASEQEVLALLAAAGGKRSPQEEEQAMPKKSPKKQPRTPRTPKEAKRGALKRVQHSPASRGKTGGIQGGSGREIAAEQVSHGQPIGCGPVSRRALTGRHFLLLTPHVATLRTQGP